MKRLFCLALAFLMLFFALTSCGSSNANGDDSQTTEPSVTTTEAPETEAPVVLKEYDISKFKIVYGNSLYLETAKELKSKIKEIFGVDLTFSKTTAYNENKYEFVIGDTDREISKKVFYDDYEKYSSHIGVVCDNGHVQILGTDVNTINSSIDYLFANAAKEGESNMVIPEVGRLSEKMSYKTSAVPEKANKSYVRVVTNNILVQSGSNSSHQRLIDMLGAYRMMDADVYTLQEVDASWYSVYKLDEALEKMGYALAPVNAKQKHPDIKDTDNDNPIYYKTDRFELVESGYDIYDTSALEDGTYPVKSYSWACLKEKSAGKQVVVITTHFVARVSDKNLSSEQITARSLSYKTESAKQLAKVFEELQKKYPDAAVIATGDYNSNNTTEAYAIMSEVAISAREKCEKKENMDFRTENTVGRKPAKGVSGAIDHIFYSKTGVKAKRYETVVSPYTYAYSDHVPVLLDFILE